MDEDTIGKIMEELTIEHGTSVRAANQSLQEKQQDLLPPARSDIDDEVRHLLRMARSPCVWAIANKSPAVIAFAAGRVFEVEVAGHSVVTTSYPLESTKLILKLQVDVPSPGDTRKTRTTHWTFSDGEYEPENSWRQISGRVVTDQQGREVLDRREQLARKIAEAAGWPLCPPASA